MNTFAKGIMSAILLYMATGTDTVCAQNKDSQENETSYIVNPTALRQKNEGWGVSLCWWANMCGKWSESKINTIVNWLVGPKNLNYNIFRYNIGGGDDPENKNCTPHHMGAAGGKGLRAEMEGFKDSSDGDYIWTRDEAQRRIMLKIKEKRPDAIFEAFSNSAPYYMTYSGCCAGNKDGAKDNLKPEYYEEFAHYLVDVCKHYKDEYGIEFRTLEPFNEPQTDYWPANGSQEGCHFDVKSQVAFLKVLHPILKESGISTVISASDESTVSQSITGIQGYKSAGVLDLVGQWNTHTYYGSNKERSKIGSLAREAGKHLWMSETGDGGEGIAGNLNMAQRLISDIKYIMPDAWVDWQYIEEWNDQWCLVKADFNKETYERTRNYYVRLHFSQYIKQGYTYISTSNEQTLAAVNENADTLVLVAINPTTTPVTHKADLVMCDSIGDILCRRTTETESQRTVKDYTLDGSMLQFTMPKLSIVTFVIPIKATKVQQESAIEEGVPYMIVPQYSSSVCLSSKDGNVIVEDCKVSPTNASGLSPEQTWYFQAKDGAYTIQDGNGNILTDELPGYYLKTKNKSGTHQKFVVTPIDDQVVKITTESGLKAFDLEGEKSASGTRVGLWEYGTSALACHRHWILMRLPEKSMSNSIGSVTKDEGGNSPVSFSCHDGILSVTMNSENCRKAKKTLTLYTLAGDMLLEKPLSSNTLELPLARGIYAVKVQAGKQSYSSKIMMP